MRSCIPAETRLALTLRYLATGENFNSLRYLFRISQPSISLIIPEVLDSIYKVLVADFIKVSIYYQKNSATLHPLEPDRNQAVCVKEVREEFMYYFANEGELPWQYDFI